MNILNNLRTSCIRRNIPLISTPTEFFIKDHIQKHKPKVCLEIWSAVAYSTIITAKEISKRNGQITSFEISYPAYLEGIQNLKKHKVKNSTLYPFNFLKLETSNFLHNKIDFLFIDAQKTQYGNYLMKIWDSLDTHATIILDDVIKFKFKLTSLYDFLDKMQIDYQIIQLDPDDWIMLIYKNQQKSKS